MKKLICSLLLVSMLFSLTACSGNSPSTVGNNDVESKGGYVIAGGSTGGTYNAISSVFAQFLKKADVANFTAQATSGSGQNVEFIKNGSAEFGMVNSSVCIDALEGVGTFEGKPFKDLRALFLVYPSYFQLFVSTSSKIECEDDLFGAKIAIGAPGSGDITAAEEVFAGFGMSLEDFKPEYVGSGEGAESLKDGHIDGAIGITPIPYSTFMELTSINKAKVIPFTDATIKALTEGENARYFPLTIPVGTYQNQEKDVNTVGMGTILCTSASVDEELVYEITKKMWEDLDELKSYHAALNDMKLEDAMITSGVPLHPGAEKYYKEIGLLK